MKRQAIDDELAMRNQPGLSYWEWQLLLPHDHWTIDTCANMIIQMRSGR